jgi:hypothetical protein
VFGNVENQRRNLVDELPILDGLEDYLIGGIELEAEIEGTMAKKG